MQSAPYRYVFSLLNSKIRGHAPLLVSLAPLIFSGCLGGGASNSSSQSSLGSVTLKEITVLSYDATNAKLRISGELKLEPSTDLNVISLYADAECATTVLAEGVKRDFAMSGIEVEVPSTLITSFYVKTNTNNQCYFLTEYVPQYNAPPVPTFTGTTPASPSRSVTNPYVSGSVSSFTSTVTLYDDSGCAHAIGSGSASSFMGNGIQVTAAPESTTHLYAIAREAFGKASSCSEIGSYRHSSAGAAVPIFSTISPVSPSGASTTPKIIGTVGPDTSTVLTFSDSACTVQTGSASAATFTSTGVEAPVQENATTLIYGQAIDTDGLTSSCVLLAVFVHDAVAPAAPAFLSTNPTSPTRLTLYPKIKGTASSDTQTIRLYRDFICLGQIGIGTKAEFESTGIPGAIMPNDLTTIYAKSFDAAGNASNCESMTSYLNDTIPPDPPVLTSTVPLSPNNSSITPIVLGTTDDSAISVALYNDANCSALSGAGSAAAFLATGIQATVPAEATTTIYATATDLAGNISECSALGNYAHSTAPAPAPGFQLSVPSSPSRLTNKPYIVGTAAPTVASVKLFNGAGCVGQIGSASRSTFITSGVQVTLAVNAANNVYAESVDVYGNSSPCTMLTTFTHTTLTPLNPTFTSITPLSPNNSSYEPIGTGTAAPHPSSPLGVTEVGLFDSMFCLNRIGTGTKAQFESTGIIAVVPPNTPSTIYARTYDAAGNASQCTFFTNYTHDALVPGRPILGSISPLSPSFSRSVVARGSIGASTDFLLRTAVVVYSDSSCSTQIVSAAPTLFTTTGIPFLVANNATTALYAATFNEVGTASPCTLLTNYVHSNVGPLSAAATQNLDGSVALNWLPPAISSPTPTYIVRRSLVAGGPYTTIATDINGTSYRDDTVSNLVTYYYVVAAQNNTGTSVNSNETNISVSIALPTGPLGLTAFPGPAQITLNWGTAIDNMTFKIYRATQSGGPYTLIKSQLASSTYIDTTVTNSTPYFYVVAAFNPNGTSITSNEASATPLAAPAAPTALTLTRSRSEAACGGGPGVVLSWSPPAYYSGFKVLRGSTNGGGGAVIASTVSNYYVDCNPGTNGNPNTNYYEVTASWGTLDSNASNTVGFANEAAPAVTVRPGDGHVFVGWTTASGAIAYQLLRATKLGGPYTILASGLAGNGYLDSSLVNGQGYFYRLESEYPNSLFGWPSTDTGATPQTNPSAPTNLVVRSDSAGLPVLAWTPPNVYNSFTVYSAPAIGGPWTIVASPLTATYTDSVPPAGLVHYKVTANWGSLETSPTNIVTFRTGTPAVITASGSATFITVSWSAVASASGYTVYRSTQTGGPYSVLTSTAALSYVDATAVSGNGYFYVVCADFADTTKGPITYEVSGALSTNTTPQGLTVTSSAANSVTLAWAKMTNATNYRLYSAPAIGGPYVLASTTPQLFGTVSGLSGLTNYYFKVSGMVSGIWSPQSAAVSGFTYTQPTAPTVNAGSNSVALSWSAVPGATAYNIERSTDSVSFTPIVTGLTGSSYTDATAVNGVLYFYRLAVSVGAATLISPASAATTPGIIPTVPGGITVTANTTGTDIELGWSVVPGATKYLIYVSSSSGGPYVLSQQTASNILNVITGLTPGTAYYFVVTAAIGSLESATSAEVAVISFATPAAPVAVVNGAVNDITWAATPGATTYKVYRSNNQSEFNEIATGVGASAYTDNTAVAGLTYSYKYLPFSAGGVPFSISQASVAITTSIGPLPPTALTARTATSNSVSLAWVPSPNINGQKIYRSTTAGGPYTFLANVGAANATYNDVGLTPGTTYYYVLTSVNTSGVASVYSTEASVNLVAAPVGLFASASVNSIALTWPAVGGATTYTVRRSETAGGPYGAIATGIAATSFNDTGFENGVTYYYVISALVGGISSPDSNEAAAIGVTGLSLQVPIELLDQGVASNTGVSVFERTRTSLDTTKYDGTVTYFVEATGTNGDVSAASLQLVNKNNVVVGSVTIPAGTVSATRVRAGFTPTAGQNNYRIQLSASTNAGDVQILSSRILVKQVNATKTKIYFPLLTSSAGVFTGDGGAQIESSANATYLPPNGGALFRREANKLTTLAEQNAWELETIVATTGAAVGAVALRNSTTNTTVDDTESLFSNSTPTLIQSPFGEGVQNFAATNEGQNYQIGIRCDSDCDTGSALLYKAGLWVTISKLNKAQVIYRTSLGQLVNAPVTLDGQRTLVESSLFSNPTFFFQATGHVGVDLDTATVDLLSFAGTDSGTAGGSLIAGSSLNFISSAKTLSRSGVLAPTNGDRILPQVTPGTSQFRIVDSALVIETAR